MNFQEKCSPLEVRYLSLLDNKRKYYVVNGEGYYWWVQDNQLMSRSTKYNTNYPLGYWRRSENRDDGSAWVHYDGASVFHGCARSVFSKRFSNT